MDDVISRQDAIMHFVKASENYECGIFSLAEVTHELWQIPSAERKGKWMRYGEDGYPNEEDTVFWQCDQCLEQYTGRTTRIPNYCPNCGADMRGEEE